MRVMVTGSRDWTERTLVRRAVMLAEPDELKAPKDMTLVHGGARGADEWLARGGVARELGTPRARGRA